VHGGCAARAFSGEVGTGSPQKMRLPKENQSEFPSNRNGSRFRKTLRRARLGPPSSLRLSTAVGDRAYWLIGRLRLVNVAVDVESAGEIVSVSHTFHPSGRFAAANSW
jgi:hypothetical protein